MEFKNFTYALLMLATLAGPLALGFEKKVRYYQKWKYLFPAILITATFFILWDVRFTAAGIWKFNPEYLLGINLLNLPIEEWSFFVVVPFACVFIYEVVKYMVPDFQKDNLFVALSLVLTLGGGLLAWFNQDKTYTLMNFMFLTVYLGYTIFRNQFKHWLTKFYMAWIIGLFPFLLINGILTALPVVQYNPDHILGIRIITIPFEDFGYYFLMTLMTITIYEFLAARKYY